VLAPVLLLTLPGSPDAGALALHAKEAEQGRARQRQTRQKAGNTWQESVGGCSGKSLVGEVGAVSAVPVLLSQCLWLQVNFADVSI
jgi:hypothetical protein